MTTLSMSSFERRLLKTVEEQAATEPVSTWPPRSLQMALAVLQQLRESAAENRKELGGKLGAGVEARSLVRTCGPELPAADERVSIVRELIDTLLPADHPSSQRLVAELRLLEREEVAFRDLLTEALSKASEPPLPVDWERFRAAEEAHARGETKPFLRR